MREPDQPVSQQSLSSDDPAVQLILDIVCVRVNLRTDKRFIVIIQTHAAQKEQRMLLVLEQGFKERVGFAVAAGSGSLFLAVLCAAIAGGLIGLIQAFLSISRKSNMMATGFILIFFAQGLTTFFGRSQLGVSLGKSFSLAIPVLSKIPVIGPAFFQQDILTYIAYVLPVLAWWFLTKTRTGLVLCSVGERPDVTRAYGYNPVVLQYGAVIFAGVLAGIGGAHMSVIYAMSWANNMINGRGIIASSLVILCSWKPQRAYLAAYLFGLAQALQIFFQIHEVPISMYVTLMMPYLFTLVALAIISTSKKPSMPEQLKIIT